MTSLLSRLLALLFVCFSFPAALANKHPKESLIYADAHMHNSNFAGQGVSIKEFLKNYAQRSVIRSTLMPIPLQQKWDAYEQYANNKLPPNYYLGPKGELYYSSLADSLVARDYLKLPKRTQSRLDPMMSGFNPMDMYAVDYIRRMLLVFPGVFSGVGEFTIHKAAVSNKITGQSLDKLTSTLPPDFRSNETMTLYNPSLVRLLKFTEATGLIATMHNDIFSAEVSPEGALLRQNTEEHYVEALTQLCKAAPNAKVIWAHTGLGRYVQATPNHLQRIATVLEACPNWSVDISWDAVQTQITQSHAPMPSLNDWKQFITTYQNRILWGSDVVLWSRNWVGSDGSLHQGQALSAKDYQNIIHLTDPLWEGLDSNVSKKVRYKNYQHLFDSARKQVRTWEKQHRKDNVWTLSTDNS